MATDPRIGTVLAGYRIEAPLGKGGMGVVYRAEHLHLQRPVALKLLAPNLAEDQAFRERFMRESRLAAAIQHPHIVTVYDAGEVDGLLYIAMHLVEGTDLSALLAKRGRLDPAHALSVVGQVGSALDAAHEHGLVHRDVKPGNVLIAPETSYLTDFGLTKRTSSSTAFTQTGQFVGTIDYIAPEQIRGESLDGRADIYSLGCVLYECLTGDRPFPRDSQIAVIYAHLEEPPPRVSATVADLPAEVDEVIARRDGQGAGRAARHLRGAARRGPRRDRAHPGGRGAPRRTAPKRSGRGRGELDPGGRRRGHASARGRPDPAGRRRGGDALAPSRPADRGANEAARRPPRDGRGGGRRARRRRRGGGPRDRGRR
ncbi:MAG TPA: serine/threonine-protein kinase [Thermoleophilaceae bacterium]|nr:serine/threonine-protein kinase [Thermoleophilaceae bacterium]